VKADAEELILCEDAWIYGAVLLKLLKARNLMKSTYEALLKVAEKVHTTIIWGIMTICCGKK
jgi:hypothetical protein